MIARKFGTYAIALVIFAAPLAATAPETSPRPVARKVMTVPAVQAPSLQGIRPKARPEVEQVVARMALSLSPTQSQMLRPLLRPVSQQILSEQSLMSEADPQEVAFLGPDVSARPFPRPDSVVQEALFGRRQKRRGSVCGDIDIQGKKVGRVPGKLNGCGLKNAVQITSVSDVKLSRASTMDCTTAKALNRWVAKGLKPAFGRNRVSEIKVAAHYACRTRNNRRGAKISEHGRGKAIDISAFVMNDGEVVTVLKGWGRGRNGRALRKSRKAACGPFGTVLGPGSDRYHSDHFHFDTAAHRSGPYCK